MHESAAARFRLEPAGDATDQMLRKLLRGRLQITPNTDLTEFAITGEGVLEPLLDQLLNRPKAVVTPAGFEPAISTLKGSRPGPG